MKKLIAGMMITMFTSLAMAEVIVSFERELPTETKVFKRIFEDREAFEMWLAMRLEGKGCDPYLKYMLIEFKPNSTI